MKKNHLHPYSLVAYSMPNNEFAEAYIHSTSKYSLKHLAFIEELSREDLLEALDKSLMICCLTGVRTADHFKQIYVFDAETNLLQSDWLMSKKGLNLMIIQMPGLNSNKAKWIWKLAGGV